MHKFLFISAAFALGAAPAVAQTAPAAQTTQVEKQKTVKKVVCKKIEEDQTTGSRLGSTSKICKTIEVPATEADKTQPRGTRGEAR